MKQKKVLLIVGGLLLALISFMPFNTVKAASGDPVISLVSPLGGEVFTAGQTVTIKWNQTNVDSVTIGYKSCPSCLDWINFSYAVNINNTTGSYDWKIPDNFQAGSNYQIELISYHVGVGQATVDSGKFTVNAKTSSNILSSSSNIVSTTETNNLANLLAADSSAYKSIVKVKTYSAISDNALENQSYGSGIIISPTGLVLTNDHVVSVRSDYDSSDYQTTYQICLTEDVSAEPNCDYLAKLVARDSKKDVALLQIVNYPKGRELITFPYLNLSQTNSVQINDSVMAIGYPSIGGNTVTITKGVVSGKADKYNNEWIKTDAVSGFGSSGGAAIDSQGDVIGITTQIYSDSSGELGYILSTVSIIDWVNANMNSKPIDSSLLKRLADLTNKQKILQKSNKFINLYPYFSIDKPADWTFDHTNDNSVIISNASDPSGGTVAIKIIKTAYLQDNSSVKSAFLGAFNEAGLSSLVKINKETDIKLGGVAGKFIMQSVNNRLTNNYLIPHKEYLIWIVYDYGAGDKDKALIDGIIKTFKVTGSGAKFVETHKFTNATPKFTLNTKAAWPMMPQDNKAKPLKLQSKTIKEASVLFSFDKLDDAHKKMSATELLSGSKNEVDSYNQLTAALDYKYVIEKTGVNFKINNNVKATYYVDGVEKNLSQNKILAFDRDYYVKIGDTVVDINLTVFTDKRAVFNKAVAEFNSMLQGLTLK